MPPLLYLNARHSQPACGSSGVRLAIHDTEHAPEMVYRYVYRVTLYRDGKKDSRVDNYYGVVWPSELDATQAALSNYARILSLVECWCAAFAGHYVPSGVVPHSSLAGFHDYLAGVFDLSDGGSGELTNMPMGWDAAASTDE